MPNQSNWKGKERWWARYFGGDRNPLSGSNSKHTSGDMIHNTIYVEVKHRQRQAIISLYRDTAKKAKREGKIPVCCVSEKGMRGGLVVCHSDDLTAVANQRLRARKGEP